ncbi:uncharacterized protein K444DRAFT_521499 [Hyaloscypha bicolor E]|uniref:Uncharacterized protein n=1 Tax=Hyaloscypha bicolor E TaxID=1095630 RepID=A0A2J6TMQ0_9HELO|nr:uncharacterized protein K444DRAFT_521499 [Hyaloscypha bicolor E]PMD64287.1 hypothetical protein K444DRAFT_521499 [Hyaloscypha bicolor E]
MCMKTTCSTCQKATWSGCGAHVPGVMDSIPANERCSCEPKIERDGKKYPPQGSNPLIGAISGAVGGLWKMVGGSGGEKKKGDGKGTGDQ